jgi:hypothetical protein
MRDVWPTTFRSRMHRAGTGRVIVPPSTSTAQRPAPLPASAPPKPPADPTTTFRQPYRRSRSPRG